MLAQASWDKVLSASLRELDLAPLLDIFIELSATGHAPPVVDAKDLQQDPEVCPLQFWSFLPWFACLSWDFIIIHGYCDCRVPWGPGVQLYQSHFRGQCYGTCFNFVLIYFSKALEGQAIDISLRAVTLVRTYDQAPNEFADCVLVWLWDIAQMESWAKTGGWNVGTMVV
jgi:hypothetical protein